MIFQILSIFCLALSCLLSNTGLYAMGQDDLRQVRRSVFKIFKVSVSSDFRTPWNHYAAENSTGSGLYIGNERILTNAHVVANARFLLVQRDGDSEPVPAKILFIANDCDLAILTVDKPGYFSGVKALEFGGIPSLLSSVSAVGYPMGGEQISITDGVVSRIGYDLYIHDGFREHFLIQVDSAINPGNSGGPVFQGQKVVGVAFQTFITAQNTGYIIPVPVVQRFLKDIEDGNYNGVPFHGIATQDWALINPSVREFYGIKSDMRTGVIVRDIAGYSSAFNHLKAKDILLKIDQQDIGLDGKIVLAGERIDFRAVFDKKQVGDKIQFLLLRDQKKINVEYTIEANRSHYSRSDRFVVFPKYYQLAGLVFTELSSNLLKTWGGRWAEDSPLVLRYLHLFSQRSEYKNSEDIVVLINKLGHPSNSYIQTPMFNVVSHVNGNFVYSIKQFKQLVDANKEKYLRIDYHGLVMPSILRQEDISKASEEVAKQYKINPPNWLGEN